MSMPQTGPRTVAIICFTSRRYPHAGRGGNVLKASIMTSTLQKSEPRPRANLVELRGAPDSGFKRLALPAVAAAVQALATAKPRHSAHEDWPAPVRRTGKPS
jgi:hypothetical protein